MNSTFTFINSKRITDLIEKASRRVVLISPGILGDISAAIIRASRKIDQENIVVIVDNSSQSIRNGYGSIEAVETLILNQIKVRNQPNLRIGLLITDDLAFIFSPLPQIVEVEPDSENKPNALRISVSEAENILSKLLKNANALFNELEIGKNEVKKEEIKSIQKDLEDNPPIKPDLARKMWVTTSTFQFVDMQLCGARLQNNSFSLSGKDLGIKNNAVAKRVSARYKLFDDKQILEIKKKFDLESKLNKIREHYLIKLPKYGSILYYKKKKDFLATIGSFKSELEQSITEIQASIDGMLIESRKKISPWIKQNLKRLNKKELSEIIYPFSLAHIDDFIESYLNMKLTRTEDIISKISFTLKITNVSDQLISDDNFRKRIEEAFNRSFDDIVKTESAVSASNFDNNL